MDKIEILGIGATLFVLLSFSLKGELKIRLVNSIGAMLFVIYGVLMRAWSIWILNVALLIIHIYFLTKPQKKAVRIDIDENE